MRLGQPCRVCPDLAAHYNAMGELMRKSCVAAVIQKEPSPAPPAGAHDAALDVQDVGDICDLLRPDGAAISAENGEVGRMDAAVDRLAQVLVVACDHGLTSFATTMLPPALPHASPDSQDDSKTNVFHALLRTLPPRPLLRLLLGK